MIDLFSSHIFSTEWHILVIIGAVLLLATEFGYRMAMKHTPEIRQKRQGQAGTLQGALLGLLGLLLGFTFAMSVARFDTRKQLVLDESNAIGTAWLRAGLINATGKQEAKAALRQYAQSRLEMASDTIGSETFMRALAESEKQQASLWRIAVAETSSPYTALFASSLNDMIDMDSKRQAALTNHVPAAVWLLLLLVSTTVCWTAGYTTALGESGRMALSMILLPILLTVVITIIADFDQPRHGLIQISQDSMQQLQRTLQKYQ
ncbi:MAG: hypothetical protein ABI615_03830 [Chthoniobacterales bacterium]